MPSCVCRQLFPNLRFGRRRRVGSPLFSKKESDSMFDQLFVRSDALTRYLSAPLIEERRQYLTHCAVQGMTKSTLEAKARLQLSIAEYLRLAERPSDTISLSEIKKAATRWSNHNWPSPQSSHANRSREYFTAQAAKWLTFLNRFRTPPKPPTAMTRCWPKSEPSWNKLEVS